VITKSKRKPLAERLKTGLTEAVQFAKGELTLRTVEVPAPPPEIIAKDVTSLRAKAGMSQAVFARVLNVSTKTVQSWEQGERKPSHAALRMLQVLREKPMFVFEIVGIPARGRGQTGYRIKNSVSSR
jgi:putative transcriptional regulator